MRGSTKRLKKTMRFHGFRIASVHIMSFKSFNKMNELKIIMDKVRLGWVGLEEKLVGDKAKT